MCVVGSGVRGSRNGVRGSRNGVRRSGRIGGMAFEGQGVLGMALSPSFLFSFFSMKF